MTQVLFLHAYPLNLHMWDGVRAALPSHWKTGAVDLPGFASAAAPNAAPGMQPLADQAIGWLEANGPAVLVGLSLGGYTMGVVAEQRPDLIEGMVFCDTRLTPDSEAELERRRMNSTRVEAEGHDYLIREYLPACIGDTTRASRPEAIEAASKLIRQSTPEGLAWGMRAMASRLDTRESVTRLDVPGHVIVGEEDLLCNDEDRRSLQLATGGDISILPKVGHYSALEDPQIFADALVRAVEAWGIAE